MAMTVKISMGIPNRIQQTTAVMTNSMAEANIFKIELKFLRNNEVISPHNELLNMTMKIKGVKSMVEKVSNGESKNDWVIEVSLESVVGNMRIPKKLQMIESTYINVF